jgi:DNA-binding transcriptional LysR family regulator
MITPRLLIYVDEVARCGTIRKASAKLNVAASSINRQIIALEESLGTPLFERTPRRMRPTAAGEALIGHARESMAAQRRLLDHIDALKGMHTARCSIATVGGLTRDLLLQAIGDFRAERPGSRFDLTVTNAERVAQAVAEEEVDLGVAFDLPPAPRLVTVYERASPCGAVVRPDHPLARRRRVQLQELLAYPLFLPRAGVSVRETLESLAGRLGLWLDPVIESDSFDLLARFVRSAEGIGILNRVDVRVGVAAGDLVFLPVAELSGYTQKLAVVHGDRRPPSPFAALVAERLRNVIAAL